MSWKENRRRKRTWYIHYKGLAEKILAASELKQISGLELLMMFYELYESRGLHRNRRIATSAFESFKLAAEDIGLGKFEFTPRPAYPKDSYTTQTETVEVPF